MQTAVAQATFPLPVCLPKHHHHCFTTKRRQMSLAQGCMVPCSSAGSKVEAPSTVCAVMEATQSPRPSTSPLLLGRIPNSGADVVHRNQQGEETAVKHAILKITLKPMRIWPLAMSMAAAGPSHSLELQLTSYIFFSPSFS